MSAYDGVKAVSLSIQKSRLSLGEHGFFLVEDFQRKAFVGCVSNRIVGQ